MSVSIKIKKNINPLIFLLIFTMILFGACAGNYARYKVSDEVEKSFKSFQALPDYAYYYDRGSYRPSAIIAIHKSYTLSNSDLWYKVDLSGGQLKSLVTEMVSHATTRPPYGYYILDPNGKKIGMYYTPWDTGLVILEENNQVVVGFPERDTGRPGGRGK
jgi:hypothetical protein